MHEKTKQYIIDAVEKGYPIEKIIDKLVLAGHDRKTVKKLAKEALNERIRDFEAYDRYGREGKTASRITAEIMFGVLLRLAVGILMFFTLSLAILQMAGNTGLHG